MALPLFLQPRGGAPEVGSGWPLTLRSLWNLLQNTLHSLMCSTDNAFANTASATLFPSHLLQTLPCHTDPHNHPLAWPGHPSVLPGMGILWGRTKILDLWKPMAATRPSTDMGAHIPGSGPQSSCCGVWASSYLRGEVLGHNFLPFFSQFFIWSNFIFCLKQKKEKDSKRFAREHLKVTEPSGP